MLLNVLKSTVHRPLKLEDICLPSTNHFSNSSIGCLAVRWRKKGFDAVRHINVAHRTPIPVCGKTFLRTCVSSPCFHAEKRTASCSIFGRQCVFGFCMVFAAKYFFELLEEGELRQSEIVCPKHTCIQWCRSKSIARGGFFFVCIYIRK